MGDGSKLLRSQLSSWRAVGVENFSIPSGYLAQLKSQRLETLCDRTLASPYADRVLVMPFLSMRLVVYLDNGEVMRICGDREESMQDSLLELLTLVYLLNAVAVPLADDMIGPRDLKNAQFFQGPHELKTRPLLDRYGHNAEGFRTPAEQLGGTSLPLAEALKFN